MLAYTNLRCPLSMIKVLKILKILISHIGCYFDVKCKILLIFYFKEKYVDIFVVFVKGHISITETL